MDGYIRTDISYLKSLTCSGKSYVSVGNLKQQTLLRANQSFMLCVLTAVAIFVIIAWNIFLLGPGLGLGLDPIFNRLFISCLGFRRKIRSTQIIALIHTHKALHKNINITIKMFKK